eukprot:300676-Amphidinium_carterae.1
MDAHGQWTSLVLTRLSLDREWHAYSQYIQQLTFNCPRHRVSPASSWVFAEDSCSRPPERTTGEQTLVRQCFLRLYVAGGDMFAYMENVAVSHCTRR